MGKEHGQVIKGHERVGKEHGQEVKWEQPNSQGRACGHFIQKEFLDSEHSQELDFGTVLLHPC